MNSNIDEIMTYDFMVFGACISSILNSEFMADIRFKHTYGFQCMIMIRSSMKP